MFARAGRLVWLGYRPYKIGNLQRVSYDFPAARLDEILSAFEVFCKIDLQLAERTVKDRCGELRRFLMAVNKSPETISDEDVRNYLMKFKGTHPNPHTYANPLKAIRIFFRDFMKMNIAESFKFPERPFYVKEIPSKEQIQKFYSALRDPMWKALFLVYATSGLRKSEVLALRIQDVDFEKCMILPKKESSRTKHAWVSFFNGEAEKALKEYLENRMDADPRLFPISGRAFKKIWKQGREATGVHITPQVLREWFCSQLGELNVPDRYVDAFCGRIPKSVLAKHYTDYAPEKLKKIYDNAGLRVLD